MYRMNLGILRYFFTVTYDKPRAYLGLSIDYFRLTLGNAFMSLLSPYKVLEMCWADLHYMLPSSPNQ